MFSQMYISSKEISPHCKPSAQSPPSFDPGCKNQVITCHDQCSALRVNVLHRVMGAVGKRQAKAATAAPNTVGV